jgi:hypothetical protein
MKYIKTFEDIQQHNPKVNDYVVVCEDTDESSDGLEINGFTTTHIGQIVKIYPPDKNKPEMYVVRYDNIPKDIKKYFLFGDKYKDRRGFYIEEIKFCSPNKEKVEPYIQANKFNI